MKIGVLSTRIPFIRGGAEILAEDLLKSLAEHGHQAELITVPFQWYPAEALPEQSLACRLMRLDRVERVVALKFPVYYVPHPDKVLWLLHQHRPAYELWGTPYSDIPATPEGEGVRRMIVNADNVYLKEAKAIYTISKLVSERLRKYNGMDSEHLYPPLAGADRYHNSACGDYLFFPSRLNRIKRQVLAVEAMKHVRTGVRLVVAGEPDSPGEVEQLRRAVADGGLSDRVTVLPRWITDEEKLELFAGALGCVYVPYGEDYGYVTLEASYSRKPLITCSDSGGPLEFVDDGATGLVSEPEPRALAARMDELYADKARAAAMGEAAYGRILAMDITWDRIVGGLAG